MAAVAAIWALRNEWLRRPEKGEPEHLARCDIVDTFIGPLVRVDRNGRYPAEWHDRVGRDWLRGRTLLPACGGSRLRSNGSRAEPVSVRVEKLRAWFTG
jgi:hypothetical protein